jgi:hypothetical protein
LIFRMEKSIRRLCLPLYRVGSLAHELIQSDI